jgi:1-acyl-sn-glycerol-3-phosphate acyltransferase
MVYCPRTITPLAKDQLFRLPVLGTIIRAIGAVPVKRFVIFQSINLLSRAQDHSGEKQDNTPMFEVMWSVLSKGHAVAIFPEGTTVFEPHIRPLKVLFDTKEFNSL